MNKETIAIIGAGNMGQAIAHGLLEQKIVAPRNLVLSNPNLGKLDKFGNLGVRLTSDNQVAMADSAVVILAVKPQIILSVLDGIQEGLTSGQLLMSVAAGVRISTLQERLLSRQSIVRVMPNICAKVGRSISAWIKNQEVVDIQIDQTRRILGAIGEEYLLDDEGQLDQVTAISGSGPAYFYGMVEGLEAAGIRLGLRPDLASLLARQTFIGAGELLRVSQRTPTELKLSVTSKGGTTQAAIEQFESDDFWGIIFRGANAAYQRAKNII